MTLTCDFLLGSDRNYYGRLTKGLEISYTRGKENYPKTLIDEYKTLFNWNQYPRNAVISFKKTEING